MRKKLSKLVTIVGAMACLAAVPVVSAEAYTYTAEELYDATPSWSDVNEQHFTDAELDEIKTKYNVDPAACHLFGEQLPTNMYTLSVENDRTGGINVRWFREDRIYGKKNYRFDVAIERYDYATKQWEFLGYESEDDTSVANKRYAIDDIFPVEETETILADRTADNYCLYEDDAAQINKTYKYRITPFNIYSQSRAEAIALGKEAEYTKVVTDYVAKGCRVVEENGYTVVFYPSQETKKVKNTLEAPYMSVKETRGCPKCKRNWDAHYECYEHPTAKLKKQVTFDIEWQDVDGYEIYYSTYSDTGFKKLKTIKPGKIAASFTVYPTSAYESETHISTAFQHHVKQSYKKYFFKVRSFVNVNGKKVYSDFSPVASNYDYVLHYRSLDEAKWHAERGELASIQATQEYNQLNRLMNERAYIWQNYLSGKITKKKLIKKVHDYIEGSANTYQFYGVYQKSVKSITMGNSGKIIGDIEDEIRKKHKDKNEMAIYSINVSYKKAKKAYVITAVYAAF